MGSQERPEVRMKRDELQEDNTINTKKIYAGLCIDCAIGAWLHVPLQQPAEDTSAL